MKIIIIGAQGCLGQELHNNFSTKHETIPVSRFNADITDYPHIQEFISNNKPDIIINTSSVNALSDTENPREIQNAYQTNTVGAVNIATACNEMNIPFIQVSCPSVLEGSKDKSSQAKRIPQSVLGKTKAEAEEMIEKIYGDTTNYLIIRVGEPYGQYGHSVVNKLERLVKRDRNIDVIKDIKISLSSTKMVSDYIEKIINSPIEKFIKDNGNIVHCCHKEQSSYMELAELIKKILKKETKIVGINSGDTVNKPQDQTLEPSEDFPELETEISNFIRE